MLAGFIQALRSAGVPVSPADAIEAHRAATIVPFAEREPFRDALCATLAKSGGEAATLDRVFDAFFFTPPAERQRRRRSRATPRTSTPPAARPLLLDGDAPGLAVALAAGRVDLGQIRFATQRSRRARQVLDKMGVRDVDAILAAARRDNPQSAAVARLDHGRGALAARAAALVERHYQLHARHGGRELR